MEGILTINPGLVFWTIVSFVLLLVILRKFAWGPILKALEDREHTIARALSSAEEANKKAEAVLAEQKALLARAESDAETVRETARRDAEARAAQMHAEALAKAEALLDRARREIALEESRAVAAVRKEAASLAIEAATRLLKRSVDTTDNRRLVDEFIREVEKRDVT